MSKALTPKAKGSGIGREVLPQGPLLMSPSGGFQPPPTMDANDEVGNDPEGFSFPVVETTDGGPSAAVDSTTFSAARNGARAVGDVGNAYALSKRNLFGGAITMSLPNCFEDVSAIRQVPDHQEVFVDSLTDMSLIVEILAYEEGVNDEAAARHFFDDLAQFNDSNNATVDSSGVINSTKFMPCVRSTFSKCALIGRQAVEKFSKGEQHDPNAVMDLVDIYLVVLRLPIVTTDILITLNVPQGKVLLFYGI
jgi:hypothetical protein